MWRKVGVRGLHHRGELWGLILVFGEELRYQNP